MAAPTTLCPGLVKKLVDKLSQQRGISIDHNLIEGANHFFTDRIDTIDEWRHPSRRGPGGVYHRR